MCQSDGVRSLTTKTDPHSSDKIEMSHISTHKATLQDNSNAVTGSVSGNLYKEKNTASINEKASDTHIGLALIQTCLVWC